MRTPITAEGLVDYQIRVADDGGEWSSESRQVENTRAYGDFGTFSIESPSDGAETSSPVNFDFNLNLKENVELEISGSSEGESFSNSTTLNEDQGSYSFNQEINSSEYQWQASISVPSTSEIESSDQRTLTVQ